MLDCSSIDIHSIDLDNDGNTEYIVCYTINYAENQIGNGDMQASSGIMLFDYNYKKIADLATLKEGFWSSIKSKDKKILLSLDNIDYIDIDNDGIVEILIEVPVYEGIKLSIVKYSNNNIDGEIDLKANVN